MVIVNVNVLFNTYPFVGFQFHVVAKVRMVKLIQGD